MSAQSDELFCKVGEAAMLHIDLSDAAEHNRGHVISVGRAALRALMGESGCGSCKFAYWDEREQVCVLELDRGGTVGCWPGSDCPASEGG